MVHYHLVLLIFHSKLCINEATEAKLEADQTNKSHQAEEEEVEETIAASITACTVISEQTKKKRGVVDLETNETGESENENKWLEAEKERAAKEAAAAAAAAEEERKLQKAKEEEEKEKVAQKKREMIDLVQNILQHSTKKTKNAHYHVLGIQQPTTASEADIKKAYRKLALRLHPDKERYNTPKAREAFDAILTAYEVLKDPVSRQTYDHLEGRAAGNDGGGGVVVPKTTSLFPVGTRVTIQGQEHDVRYAQFNGMRGSVQSLDPLSGWYTIKLDNTTGSGNTTTTTTTTTSPIIILADAFALFQNAVVCLRAGVANELGTFLVTLVSSQWRRRVGDNNNSIGGIGRDGGYCGAASYCLYYRARYTNAVGQEMSTHIRPEQFIIPTGTTVRLTGLQDERVNRRYGVVMDWRESFDTARDCADVSCYDVRLSDGTVVCVQMANVTL